MKRTRGVAAGILCLLVLMVFVYSDRQSGCWEFAREDLPEILWSRETWEQKVRENEGYWIQREMDARERSESGVWSAGDEEEEDFPGTLPTVYNGLNLMWGEYTLTCITYGEPQEIFVSSPRFERSLKGVQFTGEKDTVTAHLTVTESCTGIHLVCEDPSQVAWVTVQRRHLGLFSEDTAAYAAFALVLALVLIAGMRASPQSRRDRAVLMACALFSSLPLLWPGILDGHDLLFHLNRIEGIASGLRCGQFPVRIHASTLAGYGYAASEFYPELFLYFPAVLRLLGVSLVASLRIFELCINFSAALVCYTCARRLLENRGEALAASVMYVLCIYRLNNLYTRATLGESLAMIFFPLVLLAFTRILEGETGYWIELALGMVGICMSHLLSVLFTTLALFVAALVHARTLIRNPRRIAAILKAALLTLLCISWFMVPMLRYLQEDINTNVGVDTDMNILRLGSFLVPFSGKVGQEADDYALTIGVVPGVTITLGVGLYLLRMYMGQRENNEVRCRRERAFLVAGLVLAACSTGLFPWRELVGRAGRLMHVFRQIQFPWRLVGVAMPMLCMIAARGYLMKKETRAAGAVALGILAVLTSGYTMQSRMREGPVMEEDGYCDTRIGQFEYTYLWTQKDALEPGRVHMLGVDPCEVVEYDKQGTTLRCTLSIPQGNSHEVEIPLLFYPGYKVTEAEGVENARCMIGNNNVIWVLLRDHGPEVKFTVRFVEPLIWRVAEVVSAAGFVLLAVFMRSFLKKQRRKDEEHDTEDCGNCGADADRSPQCRGGGDRLSDGKSVPSA